MRATQHTSNNDVLQAPPGASVEECRPLAITRVVYGDGTPGVWSYWEPTAAEMFAIKGGAKIKICFLGHTHPPVAVMVDGIDD